MIKQGLVQLYTGDGKGKTTAALGLSLMAAGDGNNVLFYQFLKPASLELSERNLCESYELPIEFGVIDFQWDMLNSPNCERDRAIASSQIKMAMEMILKMAQNREYNLIVLDEICYCVNIGLIDIEQIKELIKTRDPRVEIVLTGRGASEQLIELSDLATEVKCIKHPFDKGIAARKGIEF
jgi:cob(I)alamin adenosyltransferase